LLQHQAQHHGGSDHDDQDDPGLARRGLVGVGTAAFADSRIEPITVVGQK
jgi:hypothetical protein